MTKRVGLAVMRIQPLHRGHTWILNQLIEECETAIIAIGSTQAESDIYNPWSFDQRKEMVRNVYGDRFKIIPVTDLGSDSTTTDWCEYVLGKIHKLGLPEPTDYYTGSVADSVYYKKVFFTPGEIMVQPGEMVKRLHIRERTSNPFPPATDIRTFLKLKSDEWMKWVPRVNHELIKATFPKELVTG